MTCWELSVCTWSGIVPYSGPGVLFLDRGGHYIINDVSKVGKEHWVGTSVSENNSALWRTGSWYDGWGGVVQVNTASKNEGEAVHQRGYSTSPSALVQLRAGNNLKSSAPGLHHLQEGDKRTGRSEGQEDVCLSVTEFVGKRVPLLPLLHHYKATSTARVVTVVS